MYQLTAAHRSLPIPSFVRVTNLENDKTTVVRVNDRGAVSQRAYYRFVLRSGSEAGVSRAGYNPGLSRIA